MYIILLSLQINFIMSLYNQQYFRCWIPPFSHSQTLIKGNLVIVVRTSGSDNIFTFSTTIPNNANISISTIQSYGSTSILNIPVGTHFIFPEISDNWTITGPSFFYYFSQFYYYYRV